MIILNQIYSVFWLYREIIMTQYSMQLENAIANKDLNLVRSAIITYMNSDRKLEHMQAGTILNYAANKLSSSGAELIEEDNGECDFLERSKWNESLWNRTKTELLYNFSKEKFDYCISIMKYLRGAGLPSFQVKENKQPPNPIKASNEFKKIIIGSALGGVVTGGVTTFLKSASLGVLVAVGTGAVIYQLLKSKAK